MPSPKPIEVQRMVHQDTRGTGFTVKRTLTSLRLVKSEGLSSGFADT